MNKNKSTTNAKKQRKKYVLTLIFIGLIFIIKSVFYADISVADLKK